VLHVVSMLADISTIHKYTTLEFQWILFFYLFQSENFLLSFLELALPLLPLLLLFLSSQSLEVCANDTVSRGADVIRRRLELYLYVILYIFRI